MEMGKSQVTFRRFPAKVLLFGEYSVLKGGEALALPFGELKGSLSAVDTSNNKEIHAFLDYLIQKKFDFLDDSKLASLKEIVTGTEANIPVGFGVGSSGVITAAIYDYCKKKEHTDLVLLKYIFGQMENFFHGESSGFDPLICYSKKLTHLSNKGIAQIDLSDFEWPSTLDILLLNTKIPRRTEPLVNMVKEKLKSSEYCSRFEKEYTTAQNQAIKFFLDKNDQKLFSSIKTISQYQFDQMRYLIPLDFQSVWSNGLKHQDYLCKLCGAGAGGYILIFTKKGLKKTWAFRNQLVDVIPFNFEDAE